MVQKSWNSVKHFCLCTYVSLFMILMLQSAKQFNLYLVSLYSPVQRKFSHQWFPRHLAELTARSLLPPNLDDITAFTIVFALLIQHISSFQTLPLQAIFGDNLVMALSVLLWLLLSPTHLVVTSHFDLLAKSQAAV